MIYLTAPFSMTLNDPYPRFQGHAILTLNISETVRYPDIVSMKYTNRDLHTPYSTVSFRMILSDLEWLSKIFNDKKRRAVSLRQLSLLFYQLHCFEYRLIGGIERKQKTVLMSRPE